MNDATIIYIIVNKYLGVFIALVLCFYFILKIYNKKFKNIPIVNITGKNKFLDSYTKKHIKKYYKYYEGGITIFIYFWFVFTIWISKGAILEFPNVITNNYKQITCIAIKDSSDFNGGKYTFSSKYVECNYNGKTIEIFYPFSNYEIKKGMKIKVNYYKHIKVGNILQIY